MSWNSQCYVHPKARVAQTARLHPYCYIDADVDIADDCEVYPHASVMQGSRLDRGTKIYHGAVVGSTPQDLQFRGQHSGVHIGKNVVIREYCTIHRSSREGMYTTIGEGTLLMAYAHVAHDCRVGKYCILVNNINLAGYVELGDHVYIGGATQVQQFVRIGAHAFIGGNCSVRKDVPPYVKAAREPLQFMGINHVGLRRHGFREDQIRRIHEIYRLIYVVNANIHKGLEEAERCFGDSEEFQVIASFIRQSKNGVIKGPS